MSTELFNPQKKFLLNFNRICDWLHGKEIGPVLVEVSPTNKCNEHCSYCFYKNMHDSTSIKREALWSALWDLKQLGVKAINWTGGGEPTLYEHFSSTVKFAHDLGLKQGLFTNGTRPVKNPEFFDWIRVSVCDNRLHCEHIREWAQKTTVGVCMTVTKQNVQKVKRLRELAEIFGAHYFQVRPALQPPGKPQLVFNQEKLFERVQKNAKIPVYLSPYKWNEYLKPHKYAKCYGFHFCPFIDSNGDIVACAYHLKQENYVFGNIEKQPFAEVWKNRPDFVPVKNCQNCCKNHEINKLLYFLKFGDKELKHQEFI